MKGDKVRTRDYDPNQYYQWTKDRHNWRETDLVGKPILGSDLMHLEFERP